MSDYTVRTTCRVCGGSKLTPFWSAGDIFVVGFPRKSEMLNYNLKAPLTICVCEDCWLVQLQHSVNSDLLYREFWYRSGTNEMMRKELQDIATTAYQYSVEQKPRHAERWVLDIGCNDGQLLKMYPASSHDGVINRIGIDPAKNIQEAGEQPDGWWFIDDYFSAEKSYWASDGEKYDIITAISMFYDLEDPVKFVREVKEVLSRFGVFVIQMNYLPTMITGNCVDNICHEHLTYFSLTTLMQVLNKANLDIFHASINQTNGGSIRVFACHKDTRVINASVDWILKMEGASGLNSMKPYQRFNDNIKEVCLKLDKMLVYLSSMGKKIYVYGASTRGTTLLQLLHTDVVVAAAERDQNKLGRYMVGSWLPIISEEEARTKADYFLVLPWHFYDAIKEREAKWLHEGGKFIIPLPEPSIRSGVPEEQRVAS